MKQASLGLGLLMAAACLLLLRGRPGPERNSAPQSDRLHEKGVASKKSSRNAKPRVRLANLERRYDLGKVIYHGPESFEEWTAEPHYGDKDAWSYHEGCFRARGVGTLWREIALPELVSIRFRLLWHHDLSFALKIRSDRPSGGAMSYYYLGFHSDGASLGKGWSLRRIDGNWISGESGSRGLARSGPREEFRKGGVATFEVLIDRAAHSFVVLMNGQALLWATDEYPSAGEGGDWLALHHTRMRKIEISGIEIREWNGVRPDSGADLAAARSEYPKPDPVVEREAHAFRETRLRREAELEQLGELLGREADPGAGREIEETIAGLKAEMTGDLEEFERRVREWAQQNIPTAQCDPDMADGIIINPYTGETLDARGFVEKTLLADPSDPDPDHLFRMPRVGPEPPETPRPAPEPAPGD